MRSGEKFQVPIGNSLTAGLILGAFVVVSFVHREQSLDQVPNDAGDASSSVRDAAVSKERHRSAWLRVNAADVIQQESLENRALVFIATVNGKPVENYQAEGLSEGDGQQCIQVVPRGALHVFGSDVLLIFREDGEMIQVLGGM